MGRRVRVRQALQTVFKTIEALPRPRHSLSLSPTHNHNTHTHSLTHTHTHTHTLSLSLTHTHTHTQALQTARRALQHSGDTPHGRDMEALFGPGLPHIPGVPHS